MICIVRHKTFFYLFFRYGKDGEIDRPIYDKEGVYLGKVNQGTCMCSGCVESRREVSFEYIYIYIIETDK